VSGLVLVTGISGFIAKHVALQLLQEGYAVRGTVRTASRADEVRQTLESHGADVSRLSFVEVDLGSDTGWAKAAAGCDHVQHVASPFPIEQPRDREALVPEARAGALRVLEAARAADVKRIVLTSSVAAMMYRANRPREFVVKEGDWTDAEWKALSPYQVSKTRAERAAWAWAEERGWTDRLVAVNPGFVLGPALDARTGTSLDVIKLFLEGAYPAAPKVCFPVVDVRDCAAVHVKAMTAAGAAGRRLIAAGETLSLPEMGAILREGFPDYAKKIPKGSLPDFFVRFLSVFDRSLKSVTPDLGVAPGVDSAYVTELTGVSFRSADEAVREAARSLIESEAVRLPGRG
jgi:dihydroflavonol-4-reductase